MSLNSLVVTFGEHTIDRRTAHAQSLGDGACRLAADVHALGQSRLFGSGWRCRGGGIRTHGLFVPNDATCEFDNDGAAGGA